jgi:cell division protein ZapA (FtsZ GTPase activity inhibitor)
MGKGLKEQEKDKRTYKVEVGGMPLGLLSSQPEERVLELVKFVDDRFKEALPLTKSGSYQSAALLAALNIAEELFTLKREMLDRITRLEGDAHHLVTDLESSRISRAGVEASSQ